MTVKLLSFKSNNKRYQLNQNNKKGFLGLKILFCCFLDSHILEIHYIGEYAATYLAL